MLTAVVLERETLLDNQETIIAFVAKHMENREPLPAAATSWRWRYVEAHAGKGFVSLVIDSSQDNRIVGHSAVGVFRCIFGGQEILAGAVGGIFVLPNYRGSAAFRMLRATEDDAARSRGLTALVATPRAELSPIFLGHRFRLEREVELAVQAPTFIRRDFLKNPLAATKQSGLYMLGRIIKRGLKYLPVEIEELNKFGAETDALWKRVASEHSGVIKDSNYLIWRYGNRPNTSIIALMAYRGGKPVGLCVIEWHTDQPRFAWIAECLVNQSDIDVAMAILNEAEQYARKRGINKMRVLIDGASPIASVATKRGYWRTEVRPLLLKLLRDDFRMEYSGPWKYSLGDFMTGVRMI